MNTLGFIGMGNMAGAIAAGITQKGLMKKEEVFAYAPHYDKLAVNAEKIGFTPCRELKICLSWHVSHIRLREFSLKSKMI